MINLIIDLFFVVKLFKNVLCKHHLTKASAVRLVVRFCLNRTDSGLVGLFGRDRSDSAACSNISSYWLLAK